MFDFMMDLSKVSLLIMTLHKLHVRAHHLHLVFLRWFFRHGIIREFFYHELMNSILNLVVVVQHCFGNEGDDINFTLVKQLYQGYDCIHCHVALKHMNNANY
jgi:hypothetical protein